MKIGNSEVWLKGFLLTIALNISINDITHAIMQHHPDDCYWSDVRALLNNLWLVKFACRSWGRECPNIPFYFTSPVKISRVISRSISLNYRHGWKLAEPKRTSENPDTKRIRDVSSAILDTFHDFPTLVAYLYPSLYELFSILLLLSPSLLVSPF